MAKKQFGTWRIDPDLMNVIRGHLDAGRRRRFKKNQALYEQGTVSSNFFFIEKGLVQVSIIRLDGTEMLLEFMGPHTIIGEGAAFDALPRFSSAFAVEDTEAIEFDADQLNDVFRRHPEFAAALLQVTSLKQRILAIRLEHLVSREPEGRIMELFRRLATMFGTDHAAGRILVTKLTHEEIAAMTGTSRVTVTRSIQRLRDQGTIDIVDGHFVIRS
ncbi:Crp/Fnr family transcriptional regulator [Acidiphilium sp. AL]|uniref:Crp/Fnr family transcriptional regulator n=1 Tax=Acidiphilium sp. AL TaxID=2871704 RepID=UPI0021CB8EAC|nr:Crp/Fnr family transcriptional regulator [Acidiphilium sp. AL]MCU4161844.1 Crp/Fnr family transcriptional regulator [Acidiphilium sp. AL]